MPAPVLPVFSWQAIAEANAELGLKRHHLPGRVRVAVARLQRNPLAPIIPALAEALLWANERISAFGRRH